MSMKFMGQIQQDHMKIREIEEKHKDELENKIEKFNETVKELKVDLDKKLNKILNAISNSKTVVVTDTTKVSTKQDKIIDNISSTFIPDIDTSDLKINSKENNATTKDVDLESSLDALDNIDKL